MADRLVGALVRLYPPSWRRRYGEEVRELSRECLENHYTNRARLALDLALPTVAERGRSIFPFPVRRLCQRWARS